MKTVQLNQRGALKTIAGAGSLATVGGLGLLLGTGPVTAASVSIDSSSVSVDDGEVSFVDLTVDSFKAMWDGFDVPVAAVAYKDTIRRANGSASHVLFDQNGVDQDPILLEEISSKGDGSDGWGGPGEYASTFEANESADTSVLNQPGEDGPATATAGWVRADVDWRLLSDADNPEEDGKSIESPGDVDDFGLDVDSDGDTVTYTLELIKEVYLYSLEDTGRTSLTTQNQGETVYLMGADDGTAEKIQAIAAFDVAVTNEPASTSTTGSGSSSAG